jgi:hypothetical protein
MEAALFLACVFVIYGMMNGGERDKSDICKNQLTQRATEWTTYVGRELSAFSADFKMGQERCCHF